MNILPLDMPIPIAMVEDDAPFAEALKTFFAHSGTVSCKAVFGSAEAALEGIRASGATVVLVDINLPKLNGIELIARLKAMDPTILCLVLTMYEETPLIFDALKAGACGYLLKRTPPAQIVAALEQIQQGGSPMSPQIARQVVNFFHQVPAAPTKTGNVADALTERETSVLRLLSKGLLYKEIAEDLGISMDTVRTHLRKVYEKLHVHSRTEAVIKYLENQR